MNLSLTEQERLNSCDERLQKVVKKVIETWNIAVIYGYRNKAEQDKAFASGKSKLKFPASKHNTFPSSAIDMLPVEVVNNRETIDWKDRERMHYFAGFVIATAEAMGVALRWGGDWDGDTEVKDNGFDDLAHFELKTLNTGVSI